MNAVGINQNDADILDRLFTMYDKTGDDMINYREFIVGIAPLISGTPVEKLEFACRLYDLEGSGNTKQRQCLSQERQRNHKAKAVPCLRKARKAGKAKRKAK